MSSCIMDAIKHVQYILIYSSDLPRCDAKRNSTPWKINMEPENDGLEDDFPLQLGEF